MSNPIDPPIDTSIFEYPPSFPNGQVNDAWVAYFQSLNSAIGSGPVQSFNTRTGIVNPELGDYPASLIPFTQTGAGAVASTVDAGLKSLYITTKNFGAIGDGVADDTAALQAAITAAIVQKKRLLWNAGTYKISSPLIVGTFSAGAWAYTSCHIEGEAMAWDSQSSTVSNVQVAPTFNNVPAIIIQNGRGVTIENVFVVGTNGVKAVISASAPTNYFKMMTIGNFNQNASRDSQYSPYAGFCIDPFGTSVPADGGYPGMSAYYVASAAGSSYVTLKNCIAENFIVGCSITPNQTTQNAENITFDACQFNYNKVGLSIGQSQSRNVVWRNGAIAFNYYGFDTRSYGNQTGDTPTIFGANMSGKFLFNVGSVSGMPSPIYGIYAESFSSIGFFGSVASGQQPAILSGCSFSFSDWAGVGPQADIHLVAYGPLKFDSCAFGQNSMTNPGPLRFWHNQNAELQFQNCTVGTTQLESPIAPATGVDGTEWDQTYFTNCFQQGGARGSSNGKDHLSGDLLGFDLAAGNLGRSLVPMGGRIKLTNTTGSAYINGANLSENKLSLGSIAVTVGTNGQASFTYGTPAQLRIGDLIYGVVNSTTFDGPAGPATFNPVQMGIGQISNIVGTTITINGIPQSLTTASYTLYAEWMSRLHQASLGDTSSGSNTILNVTNPTTWVIGNRIKGAGIPSGTWVTDVSGTTVTISQNATGNNTQTPLYDANMYQVVASDSVGNTAIGSTAGTQTLYGKTAINNGTYTANIRFAGGGTTLLQFGPTGSGPTNVQVGMGALTSSLGAFIDTTSAGAINFYKTSASKVGGFDSTGNFTTTLPFMNTVYIPQGTTAGTVDYTGATDSTAHLQAILDAGSQGTIFELLRGTPKFNVILRTQGVGLRGPGMAQFTGSIASYQQPFDVTKPVVTISDDLAVYNGISVTEMALYTPSGTGQKGLVFAGGAQKCYAKNIMSLGFTKSCIEFRNDDVNPCTFNAADTIFASTNVVGANGISFVDNHVAGTGWTTACEVSNFSTTAPNGYPVYCESAQTNSLSNGYIQTSYSGHGIYFKKTSSEVYYPRLNFSNVDVDNVSGYGTVSTVLDIAGTYPSNYRSATDVANLSPIMGELNTAANSYWAAGHTTLSANFTVAATTITLTSVAGLEAGMHIMIPGAGASGRNYFDQIVSISGSVVTLSQHNSSTQVNSGGDVSWGDIVNAVDTRGVLSSFSNGAIVVGATNKDGVTGDGAGLIYQSNGAGQGYWSSGDFISEWKDKQFRFLGSVSSPSVTAISRVGTTVTVTTSSAHKMGVGDPFTLSGIVDADGFNSTTQWQPTVASVGSSTAFTYTSLVSGSTTPANQAPTLTPYRGMHFNRGRLEFDNGTGSGIGFKIAAGTMGAAIFTDNINPTLNIWTPDTTNGTYDFRWGSGISTGKAMRIGNNSVGDRAYLTGNGAFWLLNAAAPATDAGGSFLYSATADGKMHVKDNAGNDGVVLNGSQARVAGGTTNPTGTTSTAAAVMMGMTVSATPVASGRFLVVLSGQMANNTLNDGATVQIRYGTGAAPTNGAAVTGTGIGVPQTHTSLVAGDTSGFCCHGIVTGLTLGTAYWLDATLQAITGGTATITGAAISIIEI